MPPGRAGVAALAALTALVALVALALVSQQAPSRQASLLALPAGGAGVDAELAQARLAEQRAVASFRTAAARAERAGAHAPAAPRMGVRSALSEGQSLLAQALAPRRPPGQQLAKLVAGQLAREDKIAALHRKKEEAKREAAQQRVLEDTLLAQLSQRASYARTAQAAAAAGKEAENAENGAATGIMASVSGLVSELKRLESAAPAAAAAAPSTPAQQGAMSAAISAAASGVPMPASLAAQVPALTSLVGVNTNPVPAHAPAAPPTATAGKRGQGAGAAHPAGSGHEGNAVGSPSLAAVVGSLASAEAALSKSLAQVCTFCSKCRTCSLRERIV